MTAPLYDAIGKTYANTRRPDPRIQAQIWAELDQARSVVNVGAGAGSYEPPQTVLAVEPSATMIAQRPPGSAPAALATAERIPLPDASVDAALCILTIHHWPDLAAGFAELRRVARRAVILSWDPDVSESFWLVADYFPRIGLNDRAAGVEIPRVLDLLGGGRVAPVPVPHDCLDGFLGAYWRRPEAYLDPRTRAGISAFGKLTASELEHGLRRLAEDVESGAWPRNHTELLPLDELDLGYRLIVADFA
ncbi:MAG: class I SAM-dependent methyltransferase [Dehalococcoidia bacterium]